MNDNINNLAFSFFSGLVICSIVSDSYIIFNNFLKNNYIKKKLNYCKKIYKIIIGLSFNSFKNDDNGNIIIEDYQKKITNPFDDEYEDYIEEYEDIDNYINKNKDFMSVNNDIKINSDINNIKEQNLEEQNLETNIILIDNNKINNNSDNVDFKINNNTDDSSIINSDNIEFKIYNNDNSSINNTDNIEFKINNQDEKSKEEIILNNNNEKIIYKKINTKKIKSKKNIEEVIKKKSNK